MNENDVQAMTTQLRDGLVAKLPEVTLEGGPGQFRRPIAVMPV
jgi:hypothetical protein